jgi:hypothetical protein
MRILAPWTQTLITGLNKSNSWGSSGVTMTTSDGKTRGMGQHEVTAMVLQEFYDTVPVMIGATSVSELKAFILEKGSDLN